MSGPAESHPVSLREEAALELQGSVGFHLAARWRGDGDPPRPGATLDESAMQTFEDDMLLYAHRSDAPFRTRVVPPVVNTVDVGFPPVITFESEGKRKQLHSGGGTRSQRPRTCDLALGETVFPQSDLAVLTIVLMPIDALNEFDVIKLVKLWEGGEGLRGAQSAVEEGVDVWFSVGSQERATLHELAKHVFDAGWRLLAYSPPGAEDDEDEQPTLARHGYRIGTLELELPPGEETAELFGDIARLKRKREAPDEGSEAWNRVVAVGGILQGLLDFHAIEDYELADVFADVAVSAEDETMRAFHKGTLLSLAAGAEPQDLESDGSDDERPNPMGIDPYLALPNIVLLHDEQRLKSARLEERRLSEGQPGPIRHWRNRIGIGETQDGLSRIAQLLAQHLPNVFHYTSERQLQELGRTSRGLDDLETFIRLRMDDLSSVLESRVRSRDRWTAVFGIALGVVTGFVVQQAIAGRPLWLVVLGAGILFTLFIALRDRLF